jgi:RimJ/RimL family protein N-acetyltransferase
MIQLEKFTEADFARFIGWVDTEKFMYQFAGSIFTFPVTEDQLLRYINDQSSQIYRVVDLISQEVIGHGEIKINAVNQSARFCRILIADINDRSKGYGKQLINKLLEIGFNDLKLHRIDLGVFDFNKAAIRCYEQCGFQIEGLLRDSFKMGDEFYSIYNMSILRDEWYTLRTTLET